MYFFNFDIKKALLFIFLIIIPVFLLTLDRSNTEGNFLFRAFSFVNGTAQRARYSLTNSISHTADTYLNLIQTKKRNRQLKAENQQLKSRLALMTELKQKNTHLLSILDFKKESEIQLIPARVIGRDPISEYHLITVSRGKKHGADKNMIVITEEGVVGYVFRVFSDFSHIILLTDPQAVIPAVVQRSRIYGAITGKDRSHCELKYLKRRDDVKIGDVIVTSGLHLSYIGGFPIGKVTNIKKQKYGLTQEVTVQPFINPSRLEEIFIVNKKSLFRKQP